MFSEFWDFVNSLEAYDSSCSYFPEKPNRVRAFKCSFRLDDGLIDGILAAGYRRCGDYYYLYECTHCFDCEPYRIVLNRFVPDRALRRNLKMNANLVVKMVNPAPDEAKEKLYLKYFKARHNEDLYDDDRIISIMYDQMYTNFGNTDEMEVYENGALIGFAIMDVGKVSSSAVYSVFDPEMEKRGLGNFIILKMIEESLRRGYEYLYLGLRIASHRKMQYKARFKPGEILDKKNCQWTEINGEVE